MATTFGERLQEIINKTAGNTNKFGQKLGLKNPQKLYYLIKGETAPSYDLLEQITNIFVDISPEWLLTGKGSMLRDVQPAQPSSLRDTPAAISPCPELLEENTQLKATIAQKDHIIANLSNSIAQITIYLNSLEKPLKNIPIPKSEVVK